MTHRDEPVAEHVALIGDHGVLIDVREPDEVASGTLPGARHIPLGDLPEHVAELDPAQTTVLLCRSGARSASAAEYLTSLGFTDVINLAGGMLAWNEGTSP